MKRQLITLALIIGLAGCTGTEPVLVPTKQPVVVIPSKNLEACPDLPSIPDPDTLTQEEVAKLLVDLYEVASLCKMGDKAKTRLLQRAKEILEKD